MGHVVGTNFEWREIPNTVTYGVPIHVVLSTPPGGFSQNYLRKTASGLFRIQSTIRLYSPALFAEPGELMEA